MTVTHDTPFIKNSVSQPTPEVKQEISTVNSTQLVLENPDAYDEIQSRFNELLQQKGDLEKTLHAEAQKHREDLRMWEYEATVLERLWKQSEKDVNRLEQAPAERSDRLNTQDMVFFMAD